MSLPQAPARYDQQDQDRLRGQVQDAVTKLEQAPSGWQQPTGTATRTAFDTATVTLPQLAERVKAILDDLVLRVKS